MSLRAGLLAILLTLTPSAHGAQKLCYQIPDSDFPPFLIVPVNTDSKRGRKDHNKALREGEIRVYADADAEEGILFARRSLIAGDCLLVERKEAIKIKVSYKGQGLPEYGFFRRFSRGFRDFFGRDVEFETKVLQPAIGIAQVTGEKFYGWFDTERIDELFPTPETPPVGIGELLDFPKDVDDLTLIYVLCDKDRDTLCRLKIRHQGFWLEEQDSTDPWAMDVLARSRRETRDTQWSYRIHPGGDTPQGIYVPWATMYTKNLVFGGVVRIDIDAGKAPLNTHPQARFSDILRRLIPDDHWNDYWLNEWPLAFSLGRSLLRIHGNSIDPETPSTFQPEGSDLLFRPTSGCLNTGRDQKVLLDVLVSLGVFKQDAILTPQDGKSHFWKRSPSIGKVFIIVKDVD